MGEKKIDEDKLAEGHCDSEETCKIEKKKGWLSEDWLSLWLGLFIFMLSLGAFQGANILGWGASTSVWNDVSKSTKPVSIAYQTVKGEITKILRLHPPRRSRSGTCSWRWIWASKAPGPWGGARGWRPHSMRA